jgi:hypothetical protein
MSKRPAPAAEEASVHSGDVHDASSEAAASGARKRTVRGRMDLGREALQEKGGLPQKKYFRQRAHCNPLSFNETFDASVV